MSGPRRSRKLQETCQPVVIAGTSSLCGQCDWHYDGRCLEGLDRPEADDCVGYLKAGTFDPFAPKEEIR